MAEANDISNHGGIFTCDGRPKALAAVYAELVSRLAGQRQERTPATCTLTYSLLGLYTCRGYQDRMWDHIHEAIQEGAVPDIQFI